MVERLAVNQDVIGSIPIETAKSRGSQIETLCFIWYHTSMIYYLARDLTTKEATYLHVRLERIWQVKLMRLHNEYGSFRFEEITKAEFETHVEFGSLEVRY